MNLDKGKRRLPIGIRTFREIREEGHYYVDKTGSAVKLVEQGKHYFLSRPRRFGKSLFVDTLKDLFEGRRHLFRCLHAWDHWDWSVRYPVVRLEFGRGHSGEQGQLEVSLMAQLDGVHRRTGLNSRYNSGPERLAHLLESLNLQTRQRVVVLVDEYDKPILDAPTATTFGTCTR